MRSTPPQPICGQGKMPAVKAFADQHVYDAFINAFSMRSFVPSAGVSGHDHFFDSFAKFDGTATRHTGEWLDEIATRAASQNEQYLEIMETPVFPHTAQIAKEIGWRDDLGQLRMELLERGLRDDIAVARAEFDEAETLRNTREHCGEAQEAPACKITFRYLYQVLRGFPKEQVFAQTLLGFEVATADPRFRGIHHVLPEERALSLAHSGLHMEMLGILTRLCTQTSSRPH